ncbi:MAG: hypothetical protein ACE5FG_01750 [Myxococcota bacterium]
MSIQSQRLPWLLPALLGVMAAGCVNHIREVEFEAREREAEVKERRYEAGALPELLETARLELPLSQRERIETRIEITLTKVEEVTPYSAPRELYEIPLGLVSIPLSLATNLLGVILPGVVPGHVVSSYTAWSFAAANPALNTESPDRTAQREIAVETRQTDVRENIVEGPLGSWPVEVRYDAGAPVRLQTDSEGRLSFHVLEAGATGLSAVPRKLMLKVLSTDALAPPLELELYVDRGLARRIFTASRLLPVVEGETVSSNRLSQAVYALDRIGFKEYSLRLEDEIYARFEDSPAFLSRFRSTLGQLYSGELEPDVPIDLTAPAPPLPSGSPAEHD